MEEKLDAILAELRALRALIQFPPPLAPQEKIKIDGSPNFNIWAETLPPRPKSKRKKKPTPAN